MDVFETELYTSLEQLPGDWDPLVSGPEDWLIAEEEMPEDDRALVWYPDENHWE